jgi:hypothetical protein
MSHNYFPILPVGMLFASLHTMFTESNEQNNPAQSLNRWELPEQLSEEGCGFGGTIPPILREECSDEL